MRGLKLLNPSVHGTFRSKLRTRSFAVHVGKCSPVGGQADHDLRVDPPAMWAIPLIATVGPGDLPDWMDILPSARVGPLTEAQCLPDQRKGLKTHSTHQQPGSQNVTASVVTH